MIGFLRTIVLLTLFIWAGEVFVFYYLPQGKVALLWGMGAFKIAFWSAPIVSFFAALNGITQEHGKVVANLMLDRL